MTKLKIVISPKVSQNCHVKSDMFAVILHIITDAQIKRIALERLPLISKRYGDSLDRLKSALLIMKSRIV